MLGCLRSLVVDRDKPEEVVLANYPARQRRALSQHLLRPVRPWVGQEQRPITLGGIEVVVTVDMEASILLRRANSDPLFDK
jgi:hypothetical protein